MNLEKWLVEYDKKLSSEKNRLDNGFQTSKSSIGSKSIMIKETESNEKERVQNMIQIFDFKAEEHKFLRKDLPQISEEVSKLDKMEQKNREMTRCCDILYDLLNTVKQHIQILEKPEELLQNKIEPYLSMEIIHLRLLKSHTGDMGLEKRLRSRMLLKNTIDRIAENLNWIIQILGDTKNSILEQLRQRCIQSVFITCGQLKYFEASDNNGSQDDSNESPLIFLTKCLNNIKSTYQKKVNYEEKNENSKRGIPRVDTLRFYDDYNGANDDGRFNTMVELSEEIDIKMRVNDQKNSILKAKYDKDLGGETLNIQEMVDRLSSREFKLFNESSRSQISSISESFQDITYSRVLQAQKEKKDFEPVCY